MKMTKTTHKCFHKFNREQMSGNGYICVNNCFFLDRILRLNDIMLCIFITNIYNYQAHVQMIS